MAELTRRSLLQSGATAAAALLLGLRPWAPSVALGAAPVYLRRSAYTGLEGSDFSVAGETLRLLAVADVAGAARQPALVGSDDAFVLAFSGPLTAPLTSGIHAFRHPLVGSFELFVTPVDRPGGDQRYEVLVDRSVGAPKAPPEPPRVREPAPAAVPPAARTARRPLRRGRGSRRGRRLRRTVLRGGTRSRARFTARRR
jgi:hypothetical protein